MNVRQTKHKEDKQAAQTQHTSTHLPTYKSVILVCI